MLEYFDLKKEIVSLVKENLPRSLTLYGDFWKLSSLIEVFNLFPKLIVYNYHSNGNWSLITYDPEYRFVRTRQSPLKSTSTEFIISRIRDIGGNKEIIDRFSQENLAVLTIVDAHNADLLNNRAFLIGLLNVPQEQNTLIGLEERFYKLFQGKYSFNEILEIGNLAIKSQVSTFR